MAEDAGLVVEEVGGDYDLEPIGPGSERAVLIARARALASLTGGAAAIGTSGPDARRAGLVHSATMASSDQTRLLLVEDVPRWRSTSAAS